MGNNPTPRRLIAKLASIMGTIGKIPKRGRNDFHKYDYVMEADLVEAVRSKLAEASIFVTTSIREVRREGTLTTVLTDHLFADGETGETLSVGGAGTGDDKGDKGLYKAITGDLKYFLMKTFLIPTGDDPESDAETDRRHHEQKSSTTKKTTTVSSLNHPTDQGQAVPAEVRRFQALQAKMTEHFAFGPKHYLSLCKMKKGVLPPSPEQIVKIASVENLKWLSGICDKMEAALSAPPVKATDNDKTKDNEL